MGKLRILNFFCDMKGRIPGCAFPQRQRAAKQNGAPGISPAHRSCFFVVMFRYAFFDFPGAFFSWIFFIRKSRPTIAAMAKGVTITLCTTDAIA